MVKCEVDDPIGIGGGLGEDIDTGVGSMDGGSTERFGFGSGGIGPSETGDLVPGGNEFGNEGRADETGTACDEDFHDDMRDVALWLDWGGLRFGRCSKWDIEVSV